MKSLLLFLLVFGFVLKCFIFAANLDLRSSIVYGPGLRVDFRLPARYFYIQAVVDGKNLTKSAGSKPFSVSIYPLDNPKQRVRVWVQVLDRNDGTYIVRFRLFETIPKGIRLEILDENDKHIAKSPYDINGDFLHENCNCPHDGLQKWYESLECRSSYAQIEKDLSIFGKKKIDMEQKSKEAIERFNEKGAHSICHYVIKENKVYRKCYGEHIGFNIFSDAILLSLTRKVKLPDLELLVNLGDWPLEKKAMSEDPLPMFSWCGSDKTLDIVMPTYDITESSLESMERVSLDIQSVQGHLDTPWENKTEKLFFRGRDSSRMRLLLVGMSQTHPEKIDAALTNMFFFEPDEKKYGAIQKAISFFDFFKFKYQVNLDGTVAAYRFPYLLVGGSLVLKQDSQYYEHFYGELTPGVHYLPVKEDLSDLLEKFEWAKNHDDEVRQIAANGAAYAKENLTANHILCYHVKLFEKYCKMLQKAPVVRDGMELIEQPKVSCPCPTKPRDEL